MDYKKVSKPTRYRIPKVSELMRSKRKPRWPLIIGVLCIIAAGSILIIFLWQDAHRQENGDLIHVPVDMQAVKNEQKSVDEGHSPWRLDPVFVTQVFVSLKISPKGIEGKYPVDTEELRLIQMTKKSAVVLVDSEKTDIIAVHLKRLIRQDSTGIWTVVAYEVEKENKDKPL
jgi:hypothetical protein